MSGDDLRVRIFELTQRRQIEMIHVSMRKQNEINGRQIGEWRGHFDQSLDADRHQTEVQTDSVAENRIGHDRKPIDFENYSTVAEPSGVQSMLSPCFGLRMVRRGECFPLIFFRNLAEEGGRCAANKARGFGSAQQSAREIRMRFAMMRVATRGSEVLHSELDAGRWNVAPRRH